MDYTILLNGPLSELAYGLEDRESSAIHEESSVSVFSRLRILQILRHSHYI